jgi:serine/threonine protein kinase
MGKSSPDPGTRPSDLRPPPAKGFTRPAFDSLRPQSVPPADERISDLVVGSVVGRYELLAIVAAGGMGRVWAARATGQHGFSRFVAMKTILPSLVHNEELRARFFDEATLAAKIHHPNVCQILDLGDADGLPWMVLEWIDGAPLSELYTTDPTPIDPRAAARIMSQVCAGLHAAHEVCDDDGRPLGAVHRDVSPQNIMVGEGIVKVTDFGIAKAIGRSLTTQAGQVRGKAPYLAPEQLTAQPVDRRTDVYAAGALLYELLTGRRAYDGETDAIILMKVMNDVPQNPAELVPQLPVPLRAIVARAMSKRPADRYPTAQAMQRALDEWLAQASPLSDSALTRLIVDRLGSAIFDRREQIKRTVTDRASGNGPARSPIELIPTLSSSSLIEDPATSAPLGAGAVLLGRPSFPSLVAPEPDARSVAMPNPLPTPTPEPLELQQRSQGTMASGFEQPSYQPPAYQPAKGPPGFLDPAALAAARGSSAGRPAVNVDVPRNANVHVYVPTPDPTEDDGKKRDRNRPDLMAEALAVQREYEAQAALRAGVQVAIVEETARKRSRAGIFVGIGVVLVALVAGALLGAPAYAKQRVERAAQDAGLSMLVSDVELTSTGIVLHDVTVTAATLGGVDLRGATVRLAPLFNPTSLDVTGGALTADGSFDTLRSRLASFRDSAPSVVAQKITFEGTRVTWTGALPDDTVIKADSVHAETDPGGGGLALHTDLLRAAGAHGAFGPWGFDLATANDGATMHLLLDASTPQGATVTLFLPTAADSPASLSASLVRASFEHLGIPAEIFGLEPDPSTQLEMNVQVVGSTPARLRADLHFVLHDARPAGTTAPFDITFTASANGSAAGPVPLTVSKLMIGPMQATADAVITFHDGLRLEGNWHSRMTCLQLTKAAGQDTFGLGSAHTPLGNLLAKAKTDGDAVVDGMFVFDTRALARVRFAPTYASTCGVTLFTAPATPAAKPTSP